MSLAASFERLRAEGRLDRRGQAVLYGELEALCRARVAADSVLRSEIVSLVFERLLSKARIGELSAVDAPASYVSTMLKNQHRDLLRKARRKRENEAEIAERAVGSLEPSSVEPVDLTRLDLDAALAAVRAWVGELLEAALMHRKRTPADDARQTASELVELAFELVSMEELARRHGLEGARTDERARVINRLHQRHHRLRAMLAAEVERRFGEGTIDAEQRATAMEALEALRRCQSTSSTDVSDDEEGAR